MFNDTIWIVLLLGLSLIALGFVVWAVIPTAATVPSTMMWVLFKWLLLGVASGVWVLAFKLLIEYAGGDFVDQTSPFGGIGVLSIYLAAALVTIAFPALTAIGFAVKHASRQVRRT